MVAVTLTNFDLSACKPVIEHLQGIQHILKLGAKIKLREFLTLNQYTPFHNGLYSSARLQWGFATSTGIPCYITLRDSTPCPTSTEEVLCCVHLHISKSYNFQF